MKDSSLSPVVTVVGSLNIDTLLGVPNLPQPGTTVPAHSSEGRYGGKGANQALAALRMGARTSLIGHIGSDAGGIAYLDILTAQGMQTQGITLLEEIPTGRAYIVVDPEGQNMIVVAGGANEYLTADAVLAHYPLIDEADVVLVQFETSMEATVAALQRAHEAGRTTILNPSPLRPDFPWGQIPVDFLIVNEHEAASLLGKYIEGTQEAPTVRAHLTQLAIGTIIITAGAKPTLAFSAQKVLKVPPPLVEVLDTVGAGDAFAGTFAVYWAETHDLLQSLRKANMVGAMTCTRSGAQDAIPTREEVEAFGRPQEPEAESPPDSTDLPPDQE